MKGRVQDLLKDRKTLYLILSVVLVSTLSLTVVYAALSVTLNITGSTEVTSSNWDIHLANPEVKSGSVNSNVPTISGNNLSFSVNLATPGDYYEFTVDVVNDGSIDAMIDSVVKTPELTASQAKYIKYEVSYQNGESITTNQTIKSGTSTPIKVRLEYRKDISSSDLPSSATELSLRLTLVYVQSDGSGSSVPNNGAEASLVRVVSGDGTQVGNEVCIKDECFYVISSTDSTVTMLAKYNLHVGNTYDDENSAQTLTNPTGKQNSKALGYFYGYSVEDPIVGTIAFSDSDYWSNTVSNYPVYVYNSSSNLYTYVENYKTYLETLGVILNESRLITYEELTSLGCSDSSCYDAPSWVYATSYWSGSAYDISSVWTVIGDAFFGIDECSVDDYFGVRPVIVIDRNLIDGASSGTTKQLIEFVIDEETYYAEEGMTWEEWVESEYNVDKFRIYNDWVLFPNSAFTFVTDEEENPILISSIIELGKNYSYVVYYSGGGSND